MMIDQSNAGENPPIVASSPLSLGWAFLGGLVAGAGLIWCVVEGQLGIPNLPTLPVAKLVNYKKGLAAKVAGRKILICAGSSSLLGLRADLIEKYTGEATVNLGVMAALGMPTCCRWAQEVAKPGDTILLAFEYELYDWVDLNFEGNGADDQLVRYNIQYADYLVAYDPDFYRSLDFADKLKTVINLPDRRLFSVLWLELRPRELAQANHLLKDHNETYADMDLNGDRLDAHRENRPTNPGLGLRVSVLTKGMSSHPLGFDYLRGFIAWCHEHQIKVLATWPNLLSRPEYRQTTARETIARITEFFRSENVPILGDYTETLLPEDQFYNSIYHLTSEAAYDRTVRLLKHWPTN